MIANIEIYVVFIFISLLASLRTLFPATDEFNYLRPFVPFLVVTLSMEILGTYLAWKNINNTVFYNFFSLFEFLFYLHILRKMIESQGVKRMLIFAILAYAVITTLNILFWQGLRVFHTITYSLGCLIVVTSCIIVLLEMFRNPKSLRIMRYPPFWICTALLFFYCCGFPLFGLINVWMDSSPLIRDNFGSINNVLNSFLYLLFTIAFLWIKTRKSISSPSSE